MPGGRIAGATLHALARVGDGALVSAVAQSHALHADAEAGLVHHHEHVLEAAVLLAHHVADRAAGVAEGEHGGGARVNAELVLERHAAHVVARTEPAVGADDELRHDEQRDALDARRRVGRAREHEVHDVVRVVVLAVGDEDLVAEDPVAAIRLRHRPGSNRREIGSGLRLGEVHGAGPLAAHHLRQVRTLQRIGAVHLDRLDRAAGEHRAQLERHVGRVPHLVDRGGHQLRHALAAVLRILGEAVPAELAELAVGVLESGRRGHGAVVAQARAFAIADGVERIEHVGRELARLLQDRRDRVGRGVFEAWQARDLRQARELVHDEEHLGQRGVVLAHDGSLFSVRIRQGARE